MYGVKRIGQPRTNVVLCHYRYRLAPAGTLSLFNLYLALSRSPGCTSILLLPHFDERLFMVSHDLALVDEDERLGKLDTATKLWYEQMIRIKMMGTVS